MKTLKALIILLTILNLSTAYALPVDWQSSLTVDTELLGPSYRLWLEQKKQNAAIKIPEKVDFQNLSEMLASNGFGPGNGGNEYIFEVDSIAKDLLTYLDEHTELQQKVSLKDFEEILQSTSLFFIDDLPKLDNRVVDALNWQDGKLILIDRTSWKKKSLEMKYKLIFHEYLGVMGIEINNAFLSNKFDLTAFLIGQKRFEMDWSGPTYIYSHSNTEEYAIKVNIDDQSDNATIVTSWGSSKAKWQERSEKLYIVPTAKVQYEHPTYKSVDNIHLTGTTTFRLVDMTIQKMTQDHMIVDETWSGCFISDDPSQTAYNLCEIKIERKDNSLVYTQDLKAKSINLNNGDLISLPVFKPTSTKLEHLITKVTQTGLSFLHGIKEDFKPIRSWSEQKNHLRVNYTNGDILTVTKVKTLLGLDRIIARLKTPTNLYIAVTSFVHTKASQSPLLTHSDVIGSYLPMYINSQHTAEEYNPYIFTEDGLGGFSSDNGADQSFNTWFWTIQNNIVVANRYMDLYSGQRVDSHQILTKCQKEKTCFRHNYRKYIPLKITGHRYTFLRVMEFYDQDGVLREDTKSSSFWVMDKL
jgi:hypothetical protein